MSRSALASRAGQPIGTSALKTGQFLLLFGAMLVAAAGNTALQSVMPAIGREIGIADFYVAVAYTSSAVLWVLLASFWAEKSGRHGRKRLMMMGVGGFVVSMVLCGLALRSGLSHRIA
ncbi:MAG: MFS transporter, partial [Sphingomonadales bacterium]|nr:MFS transporter [Sphingomonadales bacterium]